MDAEMRIERLEQQLQEALTRIDAAADYAASAGVTHIRAPEQKFIEELSGGYPFGNQYNFGITFEGTSIFVWRGLLYHAGEAVIWHGPTSWPLSPTITGLANGDMVCIVYSVASKTISIEVRDPFSDHDGDVIRALCVVAVDDETARLGRWYGGGVEIRVMGA